MIPNVCIHVSNEQPLLADLYDLPSASDSGLLCTNVRSMDGKRPVFIDQIEATFFFPYHVIRFLEIPEGAMEQHRQDQGSNGSGRSRPASTRAKERTSEAAVEPEVLLLEAPAPESLLPVAVHAPEAGGDGDGELDVDLEIDEGFLQRIRDL